jgi:hypothetical protein
MDNLEWLHKHMQNHLSNSAQIEPADRVLSFPSTPSNTNRDGATALDLVYQVAEVVRSIENRANDFESHARGLAREATERLQRVEKHNQDLEAKLRSAEACINKAHLMLQEAGEALKKERVRVEAAENQLPQVEMRARSAEARAQECEKALRRIEDAIRTQILGQGPSAFTKSHAAA